MYLQVHFLVSGVDFQNNIVTLPSMTVHLGIYFFLENNQNILHQEYTVFITNLKLLLTLKLLFFILNMESIERIPSFN